MTIIPLAKVSKKYSLAEIDREVKRNVFQLIYRAGVLCVVIPYAVSTK